MKKTLLSIGTIVAAGAPIATVISCGSDDAAPVPFDYVVTLKDDIAVKSATSKGHSTTEFLVEIDTTMLATIKTEVAKQILNIPAAGRNTIRKVTVLFYATANGKRYYTTINLDVTDPEKNKDKTDQAKWETALVKSSTTDISALAGQLRD